MRPQGGLESNFACSASGGAFRGPKRLEHYQPPETRHKHRLSLMQRVIIGMYRDLQAETAQSVQTGLHRCCSAKSCIGRLAHIGRLARPTTRVPLVVGQAGVLQNQECLARWRQATTYALKCNPSAT